METILQFGAGNFLRAFVDTFVSEMNAAGQNVGAVVVVQSTGDGDRARQLNAQGGRFHVVVRGLEGGVPVDRVQEVDSISRALRADTEWDAVVAAASARPPCAPSFPTRPRPDSRLTTPTGDAPQSETAPRSYPAKLLALCAPASRRARKWSGDSALRVDRRRTPTVLRERRRRAGGTLALDRAFLYGLSGPRLRLGEHARGPYRPWSPRRPPAARHSDPLLTVAEPFAFWAVEDHPRTAWLGGHPAIVRVPDVAPYALRKLRILNGAHSALVAACSGDRANDLTLVRQAVADPSSRRVAARSAGFEEIVPTIEDRAPDAHAFAESVLERFANPFLDHRLTDIATNHAAKGRRAPRPDARRVPVRLNQVLIRARARFRRAESGVWIIPAGHEDNKSLDAPPKRRRCPRRKKPTSGTAS